MKFVKRIVKALTSSDVLSSYQAGDWIRFEKVEGLIRA